MVTSSLDIIMKKDFLYKFAEKIYNRSLNTGRVRIFCSSKVRQNIAALYPGEEGMKVKQHIIQKIRMCLLVFLAGALLAFAVYLGDRTSTVLNENRIERTDYGEKSQEIPVTVTLGEEQQDMILQVEERQYTEDELENMLSSLLQTLESQIKGENIDLEHVKTNLNLLTTFGGYPFEVTWECQNYGLIDSDGTVKNENLPQEGEVTGINGVFTYKDFRAEHLFYIHILPPDLTEEESVFERLQEAIAEANDKTKYDTEMVLPEEINQMKITWEEKKSNNWCVLLILSVIATILIFYAQDQEVTRRMENRDNQMKQDYSELVSKLSIYLGAGMSARQAWEKIVADYEKRENRKKDKHYLYEEMGIACQEMKSGISEVAAYDHFGKRCRLQIYLKFSTLLVQNLRKGTTSLGKILKEESRIAFEDRKNEARKRGEEAGTKMLVPMMLMLCMVMIMIMVPAFLTF